MPRLFDNNSIEQWQAEGAQEITARALDYARKLLRDYEEPRLDQATDEALRDYARLARKRFEGGYSSYLEVLDAESSLFNAELLYSKGHRNRLLAHVDLYKALGGGWVDAAASQAPQPERMPGE